MWKTHGFQQVFPGFEQNSPRRISYFFDKNAGEKGCIFFVTETRNADVNLPVFAEKVGKIFFRVAGETLRVKTALKFLLKSPKALFVSSAVNRKYW